MIGGPPQPYYPQQFGYQAFPPGSTYQALPPSYPWRSVLWFFALIFFGWPMAFIIAPIYVLLSPFGACCACMRIITDALLQGVQLPCTCVENMIKQVKFC